MPAPVIVIRTAVLVGAWIAAWPAYATTVTVDAQANVHAISPLIYGDNGDSYSSYDASANFPPTARTTTAKIPILRLGGDLLSTYNWQIDSENHAFEFNFESLSCAEQSTSASTVTTNGQLVDSFIKFCQNTGSSPMVTVQMFPYLANLAFDRNALFSYPVSNITNGTLIDGTTFSQAGFAGQNGSDPSAESSFTGNVAAGSGYSDSGALASVTPNSNTPGSIAYIPYVPNTATIQQNFLNHLTSTYGTAANGGVKYYILDNEPGAWYGTHFDCYPTGVHTAAYLSLFSTYATMVKNTDPNALVIAPEDTAWYYYYFSGYDVQNGATDYHSPSGQNGTAYYPYLLSQFQAKSTTAGKRLLDYLSCHYYAQSYDETYGGVYSDTDSPVLDNLRNQSTRELWDTNYVTPDVPNAIAGGGSFAPAVIPLMQGWISAGYPGTKFAITEYSFGDDQALNGATTEADALGIFGALGVDLATRFGDQSYATQTLSFADAAIQMYTNYDGNGAHFGETSVSDAVPDTEPATPPTPTNPPAAPVSQTSFTGRDNFASYSAIRTSDGALTVMVINKVLNSSTPVTINLSNFSAGASAQVWQLSASAAMPPAPVISQLASVSIAANTLSTTVPAQSVTLFVIPNAAITFNTSTGTNALNPANGTSNTADGYGALQNSNSFDDTGVGTSALGDNTSGSDDTAVGRVALALNGSGSADTAVGSSALSKNTGGNNTGIGAFALDLNQGGVGNAATGASALMNCTSGSYNTATGELALACIAFQSSYGSYNTANGASALQVNTTGAYNTANGYNALYENGSGSYNAANGAMALENNNGGSFNAANGANALENNSGSANTANGANALLSNTSGSNNTASGASALYANTTGAWNSAKGVNALFFNGSGSYNVANGPAALQANVNGYYNVADGYAALYSNTNSGNTAVGFYALASSTGVTNIALGYGAGNGVATGGNNIEIGNSGTSGDNTTIRLGTQGTQFATYIAGIFGATAASGTPVYVTSTGQLGTLTSSAKFKKNIHDMGHASDALMALRPVTFQYKPEIDPSATPQFGLIAEEVAKVNPDLVVHDANKNIYTVRYEAVNAMLLNEFQKQHKMDREQVQEIETLTAQIEALKAKEASAPASNSQSPD